MNSIAESPDLDVFVNPPEVSFPEGTELAFKFWVHNPENIESAVNAVENESVIAIEYFRVGPQFLTEIDAVNAVLDGSADSVQTALVMTLAKNEDIQGCIALAYPGSGKRLVPVDSWIHSGNPDHPTQKNYESYGFDPVSPDDALTKAYRLARWAYSRELIAIKQLSELATSLEESGMSPRIAVLYGAAHMPLYHLARKQGAAVEREYVGRKGSNSVAVLANMMRWSVVYDPDSPDIYTVKTNPSIRRYAAAAALVTGILASLEEEAMETLLAEVAKNGAHSEWPESFEEYVRISQGLRYNAGLFAQRLSSQDEDTQKRVQKILSAFNRRDNSRFRKEKKAQKAREGLLELISLGS